MSKSLLIAATVALPLAFLSANTIAEEAANPCAPAAEAATEVVEAATEAKCVASAEGVEPVVTCPEAAPAEVAPAEVAPAKAAPAEAAPAAK